MKILASFKSSLALLTLCLASPATFTSCTDASPNADDSLPTTRPKTMDGITLSLPGGVSFAFSRNSGTSPALNSGDTETGSFVYTAGSTNVQQFQNINGDQSDISFPDGLTDRSYTYLAVNENSGVLTLDGVASNDLNRSGGFNAANESFAFYFESDSATGGLLDAPTHPTVQMDITFSSSGQATTSVSSVVLSIVGSTFPELDTTLPSPSSILLTNGGSVPFNYNPLVEQDRPSNIVPESLDGRLFFFTNGIPDPTFDFTVQFVSDMEFLNSDVDEIGSGLERVAGDVVNIGVQYTWTRADGTDDATLILSGGSNTFDGNYLLNFSSENTGTYTGSVDGGTPDAAEVSGTFVIRVAE